MVARCRMPPGQPLGFRIFSSRHSKGQKTLRARRVFSFLRSHFDYVMFSEPALDAI
jgi:hypothetical protein